jgi:hypothetical protein
LCDAFGTQEVIILHIVDSVLFAYPVLDVWDRLRLIRSCIAHLEPVCVNTFQHLLIFIDDSLLDLVVFYVHYRRLIYSAEFFLDFRN